MTQRNGLAFWKCPRWIILLSPNLPCQNLLLVTLEKDIFHTSLHSFFKLPSLMNWDVNTTACARSLLPGVFSSGRCWNQTGRLNAKRGESSMVMKDHRRDTPSWLGSARPNKARWPITVAEATVPNPAEWPDSFSVLKPDYRNKDGVMSLWRRSPAWDHWSFLNAGLFPSLLSAAGSFQVHSDWFFCSAFGDYSHLISEANWGAMIVTDHARPL